MTRRSGVSLVALAATLGTQGALAQQPAAPEPRLVAPGIVSTANGEYHPSFHAGRSELFFMRRTPGRFDYTLYVSRRGNGEWSDPEVLPFSGLSRDAAPFISPGGDTLYFDSRRPAEGLKRGSINLWRVSRDGVGWGVPELLRTPSGEPSSADDAGADEFGPVVTASGDLWFYSFRPPYREGRHYRASAPAYDDVRVDERLPDPSAPTFVGYLYLSPDGATALVEGRATERSRRDTDVFYACRGDDGRWSEALPLATINTRWGEGGASLSSDGATLWFTSDRPSGNPSAGDASLYEVSTAALPVPCGD